MEKQICHGFGKLLRKDGNLRRNVWEYQHLMFFPCLFLLGKQSNKFKPRLQDLVPIQVYISAFEPQRGPHIPMKMTQPEK